MKICVIGHTHHLKTITDFPPRALLALAEADLVLHVGNVGRLTLLRDLENRFGLTFAVYGNQDSEEVRHYLEDEKVVEFANRRIGMTFEGGGRPVIKLGTPRPENVAGHLLGRFSDVDCILFGNPPTPFNQVIRGVLVFNPGPVADETGQGGTIGMLDVT
ncbi:MAG: metallophosphoesterase, partial [Caldilineae bacterium]